MKQEIVADPILRCHLAGRVLLGLLSLCIGIPALADEDAKPIRVALYADAGSSESKEKVAEVLQGGPGIVLTRISAAEIAAGKLSEADVLVHPGGSGGGQGRALGETGREIVRKFVSDGGGYLGICAGAYLATNDYSWSLGLIDAKVVDRQHWARGKGPVQVKLSPAGRAFLGAEVEEVTIFYAQGPLLGRREWPDPKAPVYESLGLFQSEIALNGAPRGIMAGTSAIARAEFGRGRVFCFSPHPELTDGLGSYLRRAALWAAGRD